MKTQRNHTTYTTIGIGIITTALILPLGALTYVGITLLSFGLLLATTALLTLRGQSITPVRIRSRREE